MRVVAIERAPIPRWYDHAIVWCAIVTAQVLAAAALVRGLGLGTGPWRVGLGGALVAWCLVVDVPVPRLPAGDRRGHVVRRRLRPTERRPCR